jgi:hypothetical protein
MQSELDMLVCAGWTAVWQNLLPAALIIIQKASPRGSRALHSGSPHALRRVQHEICVAWLVDKLKNVRTLVHPYADAQQLVLKKQQALSLEGILTYSTIVVSESWCHSNPRRIFPLMLLGLSKEIQASACPTVLLYHKIENLSRAFLRKHTKSIDFKNNMIYNEPRYF